MTAYSRNIEDTYTTSGTTYLRRWHLSSEGYPVCPVDAVELPHADEAAIRASNAALRDLAVRFEGFWMASRVQEPPEDTPLEVDAYDEAGNVTGTEPHPAWQAYNDAQALLAAAGQDLLDVATLHQGEPEKRDDQGNVTAAWQAWSDARARLAATYPTTWAQALLESA